MRISGQLGQRLHALIDPKDSDLSAKFYWLIGQGKGRSALPSVPNPRKVVVKTRR